MSNSTSNPANNPASNMLGGNVVASTTSWGNAMPLDAVLHRIAANTNATTVELAIGARPVGDPHGVLDRWRDRFEFIGHHTVPLGTNKNFRPLIGMEKDMAQVCENFGISSYSGHPPNRKNANWQDFLQWAAAYHDTLASSGVGFAVETMYVPRFGNEMVKTGGYHLATPQEVFDFCDWANNRGWDKPLVLDASHLHIGYCGGQWKENDILELLSSPFVAELHISENDGRQDSHRPVTPDHKVAHWLKGIDLSNIDYVVDEGRRRTNFCKTNAIPSFF